MIKKLKDFKLEGKRVLVRCDFNVPIDAEGNIRDDFRIIQTLPTIKYLLKEKAKIILMSHLGDPDGPNELLKLDKVQGILAKNLDVPVTKANDCTSYQVEQYAFGLNPGDVFLLENLRFHPEEKNNDLAFAKKLASLAQIYINDAFSVCHRAHASVVSVPLLVKEKGVGLLLEKEIRTLEKASQRPKRPLLAVVGGAKVKTKATLIQKFLETADSVIVSGLIKREMDEMKMPYSDKLLSPVDNIEVDGKIPDIGPKSIELFIRKIKKAGTIIWNGPFGLIEDPQYEKGTAEIAKAIAKSRAFSVIGGGETLEFVSRLGLTRKFNHVSTGGGAMLSFLSGEKLIGLQPLICQR